LLIAHLYYTPQRDPIPQSFQPELTSYELGPTQVEVRGEDCRQAVTILKRAARDPHPPTQIHALACLFQLLHAFIAAANAFSPVVYKTIVFMLIEHMRNDPVRDFITAELRVALEAHSNIPVGILVDPVVKQVEPHRCCSPAPRY